MSVTMMKLATLFLSLSTLAHANKSFLRQADDFDSPCNQAHDEATCYETVDENKLPCDWCVAGAIPSECMSQEQAKQLPEAVFECKSPGLTIGDVTMVLKTKESQDDFCDSSSKSISGYADISGSKYDQENEDKHLFFWMFEKRGGGDAKTPFVVWLTGGECSAALGKKMTESCCPFSHSNLSCSLDRTWLFVDTRFVDGEWTLLGQQRWNHHLSQPLQLDRVCPCLVARPASWRWLFLRRRNRHQRRDGFRGCLLLSPGLLSKVHRVQRESSLYRWRILRWSLRTCHCASRLARQQGGKTKDHQAQFEWSRCRQWSDRSRRAVPVVSRDGLQQLAWYPSGRQGSVRSHEGGRSSLRCTHSQVQRRR